LKILKIFESTIKLISYRQRPLELLWIKLVCKGSSIKR